MNDTSRQADSEETQALRNGGNADTVPTGGDSTTGGGKKPIIVAGLDRTAKVKPLGEQGRAVRRQELMVILGNIGCLSAGIALGMPTVTINQLTDPNEPVHLSAAQASWFASINALSCPLGGLLSGYLLDKHGRKCTLYVLNILAIIAWMLMVLAIQEDAQLVYMQLLVSRFIIGVATGLASAPVGVYSAEISMPKIRGRLILGTSISIAAGITFIYILGYFIRNDWHTLALITLGYQVVSLLCIIPMPESPNWLISKGRLAEAKKSLNYFRGMENSVVIVNAEVATEFSLLQKSIQLGAGEKKASFLKLLPLPEVYRPLLIMMTLFAFQQLTGIFVIIVYAVQISEEAGVSIDPFMCAILIGFARLLTTCPMGVILEKWGRRRSAIISTVGMCVCMMLLATRSWCEWLLEVPYLPLVAIVAFIVLSTLGLYTLPFFMISELFPQKVRGPASGLTLAFGMFVSFVCVKTYPSLRDGMGNDLCFIFFGVMSFLALIFVYFMLPETRGRTLLEIEEGFRSKSKSRHRQLAPAVEMHEVYVK